MAEVVIGSVRYVASTVRKAQTMTAAIDMSTFIRHRTRYITDRIDTSTAIELATPRMHYESQDTNPTISSCLDWRAEIRMSAIGAHDRAPDIAVGAVDFLILQLGRESVTGILPHFGECAETFTELFDDHYLANDLDENEHFTAGMPISTVLLVLDAHLDSLLPDSQLRAWSVAQIIDTMLPTTAGLVAMRATTATAPSKASTRTLISADDVDPDWPRVGCSMIPGRPRLFGQATAYTYLEAARTALDECREQPLRIPVR